MRPLRLSILGYYGYANTGDEAILDCLVTQLKAMDVPLEITVFSGDVEHTRANYGVNAVQNILPTSLKTRLIRSLGRNRANFFRTVRTFRDSDVVLVGGGGLFYDHYDSNRYLLETLMKIRRAKKFDRKVVVVGVSLGPIYHEQSRVEVARALNMVDLITVRDGDSRAMLDELGVTIQDIHTTADFVFLLQSASDERVAEILNTENIALTDQPRIGISICGYHVERPEYGDALVAFCDYVTGELGGRVWFIPMQTGAGFDDREGAREVVKNVADAGSIDLIEGVYTPRESQALMARTDMVLAERLHGVILAMNAGVPVFGVSYKPKVSRLFSAMNHEDWQAPLKGIMPGTLVEGAGRVWRNRENVTEELSRIRAGLRAESRRNFELLEARLKSFVQTLSA